MLKRSLIGFGLCMSVAGTANAGIGAEVFLGSSNFINASNGSSLAADLANALTDASQFTYVMGQLSFTYVEVGWSSVLAQNGVGDDIALYELNSVDSFLVTINGITNQYAATATGNTVSMAGTPYALNRAQFDLGDFGIGLGDTTSSLRIGIGINGGGHMPTLSYVEALNYAPIAQPVPEPETYAMLLAGLGLMGVVARRRKQARAAEST